MFSLRARAAGTVQLSGGHLDNWNLSNMDVDAESGKAFLKRHVDLANDLQVQTLMAMINAKLEGLIAGYVFDTVPEASNLVIKVLEAWMAEGRISSYSMTVERSEIIVNMVIPPTAIRTEINYVIGP